MTKREQNLVIAACEIVGNFKQFGPVLQLGDNDEYGSDSPIAQLIEALGAYEYTEFTCETVG